MVTSKDYPEYQEAYAKDPKIAEATRLQKKILNGEELTKAEEGSVACMVQFAMALLSYWADMGLVLWDTASTIEILLKAAEADPPEGYNRLGDWLDTEIFLRNLPDIRPSNLDFIEKVSAAQESFRENGIDVVQGLEAFMENRRMWIVANDGRAI